MVLSTAIFPVPDFLRTLQGTPLASLTVAETNVQSMMDRFYKVATDVIAGDMSKSGDWMKAYRNFTTYMSLEEFEATVESFCLSPKFGSKLAFFIFEEAIHKKRLDVTPGAASMPPPAHMTEESRSKFRYIGG